MRRAICCVLSLAVSLALGCGRRGESEPIWVGHIAPLSGADKARGEQAKQGIRLAVEEANAAGDVIPGRRVAVDHADTRSDPAAARAVLKRLLTVNRVAAVLGGTETAKVENLGALAQSNATPFMLSAGAPPHPAAEYVFFTGLVPARQGQTLARFADHELKVKHVAVLTDGSRGAVVDAFTRELPGQGIAGTWTYQGADKLRPAAEEALAKKPDAVLFAGSADDFAALARAGQSSKAPVLFAGDETGQAKLQAAQPAFSVYLATTFAADNSIPAIKAFINKYQEHFDDAPDVSAALAYDDARLLFEAMRQAKSADGAKVQEALAAIRFDALTGPLRFDKDHTALRTLFIIKLQDGRAGSVKRYEPEEKTGAAPRLPTALARSLSAR
jgi:branched-chain amino acid transport system substrate-binding protein